MSAGHGHAHSHDLCPEPVVVAWRRALSLDGADPRSGDELVTTVRRFLSHLLPALRERGCLLVGHVKGLVDVDAGGRLLFSVTSFDGEPSITAELNEAVGDCALTINVIVFGADEQTVAAAVLSAAQREFSPWRLAP